VSEDRANTRRKQTRPPPLDLNTVATITPSPLSFLSTPSSTLENVKLAKNEIQKMKSRYKYKNEIHEKNNH
jgi:hypothetical protein